MPDFDDEIAEPPPAEGVRILGAEEAQAAVEGGPDRARPEEPPRRRRRSAPPDDIQPAARFPLPADRLPGDAPGPSPRPAPAPAPPSAGEPSGSTPLPHWTEPATGEVPMIADEPGDEEVWASASNQPRFRSDAGDWGDGDFASATKACTTRPPAWARSSTSLTSTRTRSSPRRSRLVARRPARSGPGLRARVGPGARPPPRRRPSRRSTMRATGRASHHRATTSPHASSPARPRRGRAARVRHRPRRHRGAGHRDRRRRRVRAVRGLPPRRLPARDAHRAARLAGARRHRLQLRRAGVPAGVRGRGRVSPCSGTWPRSCTPGPW